jgi:uncharacterized membrane protein YhaH (DUF805 family)
MTFGESIRTCFSKYAVFKGCASRSEYWWWILFTVLASVATGTLSDKLSAIFCIGTFLPMLAVGARRLHDTDRSGWFLLLYLIPIIGFIILLFWSVQATQKPNRFSVE